MEGYRLVSILLKNGSRLTGKLYSHFEGMLEVSELKDVVEQYIVLTPQGSMIHGLVVGNAILKDDYIMAVIDLDKNSPLWQNYFQTYANLEVKSRLS